MTTNFQDWLQAELDQRSWSQSELVRQARTNGHKLTTSQISRILNQEQEGTVDVIMAIASGLDVPREEVFRRRGWLPTDKELDPLALRIAKEMSALPPRGRQAAFNAMESLLTEIRQLTANNYVRE